MATEREEKGGSVHRHEPVVSTCLHAAKSNHAARVHVTAVEDEAQSGKAQSGKEETGAQQRLQVEERRRSGKAAMKKAFAAAAARRLAARGCATGRQAPALAALMRGVGTSHPAHELRSTPEVVSIPPHPVSEVAASSASPLKMPGPIILSLADDAGWLFLRLAGGLPPPGGACSSKSWSCWRRL